MQKPTCPETAAQVVTRRDFELLDSYLRYWAHSCSSDKEAWVELRQWQESNAGARGADARWCREMQRATIRRQMAMRQAQYIRELGPRFELTFQKHEDVTQAKKYVQLARNIRLWQ